MRFKLTKREGLILIATVAALAAVPACLSARWSARARADADAQYITAQGKADRAIADWQASRTPR